MNKIFRNILCPVLLIALFVLPVNTIAKESDGWEFTATPYIWMIGQKGEVATLPPAAPADIDIPFSDIFDNLDMAFLGIFQARKGRFALFSEVLYLSLETDSVDTPGPFYSGAEYNEDLWAISFGSFYTLTQSEKYQLDAIACVRFLILDNELKLRTGTLPGNNISADKEWNDYHLGLKGNYNINNNFFLTSWYVAAVAGDSDKAWDLYGGVGYKHSESFSFSAGYRYQEVDYDSDDFLYDVEIFGPTIGLNFKF